MMLSDPNCLFCKIVAGEIPATVVFESATVLGFNDVNPQAPTHVLFIPKHHVASHAHVTDPALYADVMSAIQTFAQQQGLADYRLVSNTGVGAGQSVFHWHVHLLAGRPLLWPPG
jgi:histidine triad (HIT) family protein